MTDRTPPDMVGGVTLLERAVSYTLGSLTLVRPDALSRPTPCADWDLRALLGHMNDSLAALNEAAESGLVEVRGAGEAGDDAAELVVSLRDRACQLLGAWTGPRRGGVILIDDWPLTSSVVASTGALEIAVHGWDVAEACESSRPIPTPLAVALLELAPLIVTEADRPSRFASPVDVSPLAGASDRLIAFCGRDPALVSSG